MTKWFAGIVAPVIVGVLIFWFTEGFRPQSFLTEGSKEPQLKVSQLSAQSGRGYIQNYNSLQNGAKVYT